MPLSTTLYLYIYTYEESIREIERWAVVHAALPTLSFSLSFSPQRYLSLYVEKEMGIRSSILSNLHSLSLSLFLSPYVSTNVYAYIYSYMCNIKSERERKRDMGCGPYISPHLCSLSPSLSLSFYKYLFWRNVFSERGRKWGGGAVSTALLYSLPSLSLSVLLLIILINVYTYVYI